MTVPISYVNSPVANGKSPNVIFSDVLQGTLNQPIITLVDGIINIISNNGTIDYSFPKRITDGSIRLDKFSYAAGTKGVFTMNLANVVPVVNKVYKWQIISGDGSYSGSGIALASDTSATDLATAVNASMLNAGASAVFTNTVAGTTITVSEVAATTLGFTLIFSDTNATFGTTTANVASFGLVAQVALYKPSVTAGTFNLYQWIIPVTQQDYTGAGQSTQTNEYIQLWLDTTATNYAQADALIMSFADGGTFWGASYSQLQMQNMFNIPK